MTDRELLEAAAKAAGYEVSPHGGRMYNVELMFLKDRKNWNPLESDADAFRLLVDCEISLEVDKGFVDADGWLTVYFSDHNNDKHAATRRAIVRAAAGE